MHEDRKKAPDGGRRGLGSVGGNRDGEGNPSLDRIWASHAEKPAPKEKVLTQYLEWTPKTLSELSGDHIE